MEICQRMGWSVEKHWLSLSDWERDDWLAWEHRRREKLNAILDKMTYDETKTETDANGVQKIVTKHFVKDYGAYISVLRELEGV